MPPKLQCADWIDWRADHPSRDHGHTRPVAPTLLRAPSLTEPLAGALPQAELEVFYYELSPHQHLSDLHRVRCLAETHPQIESVRIHKAGKQYDPSDFNVYGRAKSYRQAPFDLAIELAASGALIHVGIHTNKINRKDLPQQGQPAWLIAYWWRAVHGPLQKAEAERAQAVWWDICEIDHNIPPSPLGPVYRELAAAAAASGGKWSKQGDGRWRNRVMMTTCTASEQDETPLSEDFEQQLQGPLEPKSKNNVVEGAQAQDSQCPWDCWGRGRNSFCDGRCASNVGHARINTRATHWCRACWRWVGAQAPSACPIPCGGRESGRCQLSACCLSSSGRVPTERRYPGRP